MQEAVRHDLPLQSQHAGGEAAPCAVRRRSFAAVLQPAGPRNLPQRYGRPRASPSSPELARWALQQTGPFLMGRWARQTGGWTTDRKRQWLPGDPSIPTPQCRGSQREVPGCAPRPFLSGETGTPATSVPRPSGHHSPTPWAGHSGPSKSFTVLLEAAVSQPRSRALSSWLIPHRVGVCVHTCTRVHA